MFTNQHKMLFSGVKFSELIDQYERGAITNEIDNKYLTECIASNASKHPDYARLAGYLALEEQISNSVDLSTYTATFNKELTDVFKTFFDTHYEAINNAYEGAVKNFKDGWLDFDIFSVSSAERVYLLKNKRGERENMLQTFMREAIATNSPYGIDAVLTAYNDLINKKYTFATPTIMNGGRKDGNLSSCFLLYVDDSIDAMYDKLKECAKISMRAGGIGLAISPWRGEGSYISSTGGTSTGIIPHLKPYESCARAVNQGGKRKGSFSTYLEVWHTDVFGYCELRKNHGKEELRARDLFIALYTNDLFMERVKQGKDWTLFCPNDVPQLVHTHGRKFRELYELYESEGMGRQTVSARKLWAHILVAVTETGTPYIVNKDAVNAVNMQDYAGMIYSSNLCAEIVEHTSNNETAVCNLATISVVAFYNPLKGTYDWKGLSDCVERVVRGLNVVIDSNYYPSDCAERSNQRHRPTGLGIQGLANLYASMRVAFDSQEAREINRRIAEVMYFHALKASNDLVINGVQEPFDGFSASKYAQGILHYDRVDKSCLENGYKIANFPDQPITDLDWNGLKDSIMEHGICNSLLVAHPPTATTGQLLGNNECFEPFTYNMYVRRTLSGDFIVINKHLVSDLEQLNLWGEDMAKALILSRGSVQDLPVPQWVKDVYKTTYELDPSEVILQARDRMPYVCQSQSMNLWIKKPTSKLLNKYLFMGHGLGLKTIQYYCRTEASADGLQGLGLSDSLEDLVHKIKAKADANKASSMVIDSDDDCLMCGA